MGAECPRERRRTESTSISFNELRYVMPSDRLVTLWRLTSSRHCPTKLRNQREDTNRIRSESPSRRASLYGAVVT